MSLSNAEKIAKLPPNEREGFIATLSDEAATGLLYEWRDFHARPEQIAPDGKDWDIWLVMSGRGWGKTRAGAEWIREEVINNGARRVAIVAETAADARDVIVEGDSGILRISPKHERPDYSPTKRRLSWPNGATGTLYNATEPDQLRGPQHDRAWSDELAKWKYARETWDMLQMGLRLGSKPQQMVTTTPRPIKIMRDIVAGKEGIVRVSTGHTLDNASNLSGAFLRKVQQRYEGTRLGKQELHGEILSDLPGALWNLDTIDSWRVVEAPQLSRIVVAVDHAVTDINAEEANEHGIIVAGLGEDQSGYLLRDASFHGTQAEWGRKAVSMFNVYGADAIIIEKNQGGDLVKNVIRAVDPFIPIIEVWASRGKHVRAEPIASMSEQGRIRHVGRFPELEDQMCDMTTAGYQGENSPDRVDAYVWAFSELFPTMAAPRISPRDKAKRKYAGPKIV